MNQRESSRKDFISHETAEDIQLGCLQRIADATEKMASNYQKMQTDIELYKRWYNEKRAIIATRDKTISNMRGQITKLKNKLKVLNEK